MTDKDVSLAAMLDPIQQVGEATGGVRRAQFFQILHSKSNYLIFDEVFPVDRRLKVSVVPPPSHIVWMPGGVRTEIHLTGADTDGAFCLLIDNPPVDWSLPAHIHTNAAETIHIVEGEFEMIVDGRSELLGAGQTLHVPAGVVHSGSNAGASPGRRLLTFSPAGMEQFFREAGAASHDAPVDRDAAAATAIRHGWRFVT